MKKKKDIRKLLQEMAAQETALQNTRFLAPCVQGGQVRTRISGLVYTFQLEEPKEGWGIIQPVDAEKANWLEDAPLFQVEDYLALFPRFRLRLAYQMEGQTWLAFPVNASDARQRLKKAEPVLVHLVGQGAQFEQIETRFDGATFWFHSLDRRADPQHAELMREPLADLKEPEKLTFKDMTPEMRITYELAYNQSVAVAYYELERLRIEAMRAEREARREANERRRAAERRTWDLYQQYQNRLSQSHGENRIKKALEFAGAKLRHYEDRGHFWLVHWTGSDGYSHTSAVQKNDLTVLSSGICLDGRDNDFDLQSLVKVMAERPDWSEY